MDKLSFTRREFMKAAGITAGSLVFSRLVSASEFQADRPNIIFLLTDDQRNDTLGCAGHPIIKTPNIDRLAQAGVRFENTFVVGPICGASRASIFTGLHERTHGFTFNKPPVCRADTMTSYPVLMRQAGYHTGLVGHIGCHMQGRSEMFDYIHEVAGIPGYLEQQDGSRRHTTEIHGDRAEEFIKSQPSGQPFCLSVSFLAPHALNKPGMDVYPWPKAVDDMYDNITIPPPALSAPKYFETLPNFLKKSINRIRYFWRWDTPEKYQKNMRAYFRMISGIDHVVGRIIKTLEKQNIADNTIIIYTADNGYYMGDRGFAGKWSHFDQSLRVPLVIYDPRLPKVKRGRLLEPMVLNIDWPATMVDMAGLKVPEKYQGRSLVPLIQGRQSTALCWRKDFFCEHLYDEPTTPKWEGVRSERYKYIRYFEQDPTYEFLHDLRKDPTELRNFVNEPDYADTLKYMRKRCDDYVKKYKRPQQRNIKN